MADLLESETIHEQVAFEYDISDDDKNDYSNDDLDDGMY